MASTHIVSAAHGAPVAPGASAAPDATRQAATEAPSVAGWYREHFAFVWRTLRCFGIPAQNLDDAVQDVFLVVQRRLADFDRAGSARAWLFGIARHVAREQRRRLATKGRTEIAFLEREHTTADADPQHAALRAEAAALVERCLSTLDEDKRWVFILADLEGLSGPELAEALELNLNTAYARLRAARKQFAAQLRRERARAKE